MFNPNSDYQLESETLLAAFRRALFFAFPTSRYDAVILHYIDKCSGKSAQGSFRVLTKVRREALEIVYIVRS